MQEIKRDGVTICNTSIPYDKNIILDMMNNGYEIYQDGKKLKRKDVK